MVAFFVVVVVSANLQTVCLGQTESLRELHRLERERNPIKKTTKELFGQD